LGTAYKAKDHSLVPGYTLRIYGISQDRKNVTRESWHNACKAFGGFNPFTKTFRPLIKLSEEPFPAYLDTITAAVEAGIVLKGPGFVSQLFADKEVFDEFLNKLERYDHHLIDRWYDALRRIAGYVDETGFASDQEIVDGLRRVAYGFC
jgi:hypothetical protein